MNSQHFPIHPYDVLLIDPPWAYYGQQDKWGAAAKFYNTMTDEEIAALPVKSWLNDRSVAFIWATSPRLNVAISVIESWGLHYRGVAFVWIKTAANGTPLRAQGVRPSIVKPLTEFVLAASTVEKGRPLKLSDESVIQTVFAPKQAHSQKPTEVHDRIESLYPNASRAELFARAKRQGWDCYGDEVNRDSHNRHGQS